MSTRVASARRLSSSRFLARVLAAGKPSALPPRFIPPALATARTQLPTGSGYVHEAKLDGYRMQAHLHDGRVTLLSRNALDWTARLPAIADDVARLPAGKLVLGGEVSLRLVVDVPTLRSFRTISSASATTVSATLPSTPCTSTASTCAVRL
jgi:ATP-dependent DNA ligase